MVTRHRNLNGHRKNESSPPDNKQSIKELENIIRIQDKYLIFEVRSNFVLGKEFWTISLQMKSRIESRRIEVLPNYDKNKMARRNEVAKKL